MGWVRFLLAAAVVFHHSSVPWNLPIVDGHQAVRLFYIISGFYMAMILDRKYPATREGVWLFYGNRFLRIFPIYWLVLATAGLFYATAWAWLGRIPERFGWYLPLIENGHGTFLAGLGVSQLVLFGLDWFNLFDFQGPTMGWSGAVPEGRPAGFLCLVPQAWTLAVELSFYLFAPWIVRAKTGLLGLLCAAGFAIRIGLWVWRPLETGSLNYLVSAPTAFFPFGNFKLSLDTGWWLGLEIFRRDVGIAGAHAGSFVGIRPFAGWMGPGDFLHHAGRPDAGLV